MPNWKPFIISQNFFAPPASSSSSPFFLRLPTELLLLIFHHADPLDKVCLALSCRYLLRISALASLKVPFQPMEELLRRVKPIDARGKPKTSWGLCVDCMQYRPTRKSYWNTKQVNRGNTKAWDMAVKCWNVKYSLQCPQCWQG